MSFLCVKPKVVKPLLKWVGGKTQILDKLMENFPSEMNNYHEIFLGGGSVLLSVLSYVNEGLIKIHGKIYASDANETLIYVYKNIQSNHTELFEKIQDIIKEFNECDNGELNRAPKNISEAKVSKENYYYWVRSEYNKLSADDKKTVSGSAMFIFLNKTCFRGVFRIGPKGFNVPYGHNKNPEIINKSHLDAVNVLVQRVEFVCSDFTVSLSNIEEGDYLYLDPPYAPEKSTSFVGYTENGFDIDMHNNLFDILYEIENKNKNKFMMSNSDVELVREKFPENCYKIIPVLCKRSINSKNPDAKAKEVIIKNY